MSIVESIPFLPAMHPNPNIQQMTPVHVAGLILFVFFCFGAFSFFSQAVGSYFSPKRSNAISHMHAQDASYYDKNTRSLKSVLLLTSFLFVFWSTFVGILTSLP